MDLVVIMPHMQLAYIGIVHKCHKIIEVPWGYYVDDYDEATADDGMHDQSSHAGADEDQSEEDFGDVGDDDEEGTDADEEEKWRIR